jgi:hypothetical protein
LKTTLANQEKDILRLLGGTTSKTSSVITCTWTSAPQGTTGPARLECDAALAVSGNYVAAIHVAGLPAATSNKKNRVQVVAADASNFFAQAIGATAVSTEPCPSTDKPTNKNLSCDDMEFQTGESALVEVHRDRWFGPSYGGWRSNAANASKVLRRDNRRDLSLVVSSNVKAILLMVTNGAETRSALIPVVYQLWAFETGGFYGFSNLADQTIVTHTGTDTTHPVHVDHVRSGGQTSQESGIFVSMAPRNYPFLGIGFGIATNSDRSQSFFLGPSVRLIGFGDHGLASFSVAIADRQVRVFRGIEGKDFAADSASLKGELVSKLGYALLINLGFKFGGTSNGTTSTGTTAPAASQ